MITKTTTFLLRVWGVEKETSDAFETQFLVTMPVAFFVEMDALYDKLIIELEKDPNPLAVTHGLIYLNDPVNHPTITVQDGESNIQLMCARLVLHCSNMPNRTAKKLLALHGELSNCGKHYTYQSQRIDYTLLRFQTNPIGGSDHAEKTSK